MKLWIDDVRPVPEGWTGARNYDEAISLLETGLVSEISFDHDLGEESRSGYEIICWIEERIALGDWTDKPVMHVHSDNGPGIANIRRTIERISIMTPGEFR